MEWITDLASVLTAIGTLAAVVVAVLAVRHESAARQRAEERAERAEAQREAAAAARAAQDADAQHQARRAQALQVIAWVEHQEVSDPLWLNSGAGTTPIHTLFLVNHSTAPVFDVELGTFDAARNQDATLASFQVVPAGGTKQLVQQGAGDTLMGLVTFRDLAGVRWRRFATGRLAELDEYGREK